MASTDLLFSQLPNPPGGPVEIVFGDDGGIPADAVELLASGSITGLRGRVAVRVAAKLHAAGTFTGLRGRIGVRYDVNVERPLAATTVNGWQNTRPVQSGTQQRFEQARPTSAALQTQWQNAAHLGTALQTQWQQTRQLAAIVHQALQQAQCLATVPTAQRFEQAQRLRADTRQRMQQAQRLASAPTAQRFEDATRLRHLVRSGFEWAQPLQSAAGDTFGHGLPLSRVIAAAYQQARKPPPGIRGPAQPPQPEPCYLPRLPAHLVFDDAWSTSTALVFVCERHGPGPGPDPEPGETIVVPVRRVYMTVNSITLTRVSDGMPLPADGFAMSIDTDSWTWQWSASMQPYLRQYLAPVAGVPVAVEATINGVPYRLCAESISSSRSFGNARISVRGRGLGAVLDAPYAPTQNFGNLADRTAQQLMADVLTINGVPIGWEVHWGLTDWLVPAGAWSHQGNYLSAITAIAAAAGGYVQPHATLQTLRILPRYPHKPWDWDAVLPDVQLPAAVVSVEGIEWTTKPAYNRVYISGVAHGALYPATRAGTAGTTEAPMVTDALITHVDAASQRALAVLADTGAQARVTLKLPVLAETGLILPGKYVRYTDGPTTRTGIVRGTAVDWSRPTLRQTLQLETHGTD